MPFLPPNQQRQSTEGICIWIGYTLYVIFTYIVTLFTGNLPVGPWVQTPSHDQSDFYKSSEKVAGTPPVSPHPAQLLWCHVYVVAINAPYTILEPTI